MAGNKKDFSFPLEGARQFQFCFEDHEAIQDDFVFQEETNFLKFPVITSEFPEAVLGVMDRYTLGELDAYTLDIRMWPDMSALIPAGGAGSGGLSIFAVTAPYLFLFPYLRQFSGKFELDTQFAGGYGLALGELFMRLQSNSAQPLPSLMFEKDVTASNIEMRLKNDALELLSYINIACRSILGHKWTLGEMDPYVLGELDPFPLWYFSEQAAAAMRMHVHSAEADVSVEPPLGRVVTALRIEGTDIRRDATVIASGAAKRLSGLTSRRPATLGELDAYTLGELDTHTLNMYFYGKIPAVITAA